MQNGKLMAKMKQSNYGKQILTVLFLVFVIVGLFYKYGWEGQIKVQRWNIDNPRKASNVPLTNSGLGSVMGYNFEDLNCISTIPEEFVGAVGDMPILIPESLALPPKVLACLYHRYVTSVQTLCAEPKLFGHANEDGGYVCVDKNILNKNACEVVILGSVVDSRYISELKTQYGCNIRNVQLSMFRGKPSLFVTMRKWIPEQVSQRNNIDLIVLNVSSDSDEIYAMNELFHQENIMNRIKQISLRININPMKGESLFKYEQWLLNFKQIFKLNFRIFSYNREVKCRPNSIETSKFLSCYTVNFIRPGENPPSILNLPSKSIIQNTSGMDAHRLFDRFLSSTQILCHQNVRVGNIKSGGWNVCHDPPYRPMYPCLVYSFGISWDWTFDEGMARTYGCEVHSFDPTIGRKSHRYSEKIHFHNLGIGGSNRRTSEKWELRTLSSIMAMLKHTDRYLDILKLDVEGSEWRALPQMFDVGVLSRVRQLYVEFHARGSSQTLLILKKIHDLGFRIFWSRKNLVSSCLIPMDNALSTSCFEIYYINTKFNARL